VPRATPKAYPLSKKIHGKSVEELAQVLMKKMREPGIDIMLRP